jgi:hypothetical protein
VATPYENPLSYTTRINSQGLVYCFPELEKVYRRRLNCLTSRRLLESHGEEAISDIQFLFEQNNPTTVNTTKINPNLIMSNLLRPLNFTAIQDTPHTIPNKAIKKLPVFQGNNVVSANTHLLNVDLCIGKWCCGHDEEDVKMTLFVYSLEGDVVEWFSEQDHKKFSTLAEIQKAFRERWGDQKETEFC